MSINGVIGRRCSKRTTCLMACGLFKNIDANITAMATSSNTFATSELVSV